MAATYEPIATTTLGSAQATVTFSSIPATYTDLVLITSGQVASGGSQAVRVRVGNGSVDSGNNYSFTYVLGSGAAGQSGRGTNASSMIINRTASSQIGSGIASFMNYANTTTNKTVISSGYDSTNFAILQVNLWRSTAAIDTITLFPEVAATFNSGFTFTLYGIAAA